ncbi:MAG TPA: NUDIX domain-containing protein [Gemmatimonadales bacterium]|nr:NUDIX domain-containing protein [Gemmatimonadales bacterium]
MTSIQVKFVDTFVLRGAGDRLEVLVLRRAPGGRNPGSWETVHGTIEPGETPVQASLRELREETGLEPQRFYNLSRIEGFYLHAVDELAIIPAFAAMVAADSEPRLSDEHDAWCWLAPADAARRFAWPRERRALDDVLSIVGAGDGGLLDDVLRVS